MHWVIEPMISIQRVLYSRNAFGIDFWPDGAADLRLRFRMGLTVLRKIIATH
ncbi:MAG: hypothetical protein ACTXOO_03265 [Sodalis sp. (in: enterobacteria)]